MNNYIQTVLGPIPAEEIGFTSTHEHVFCDSAPKDYDGSETIEMADLGKIAWQHHLYPENLRMTDEQTAIDEIRKYYAAGGRTMIDCTSYGLGRDPEAMVRVSKATGVNIVMGTGVYVEEDEPEWITALSDEEKIELFVREIEEGVNGIKAGFIGEIGMRDMGQRDQALLRAAAVAQKRTGTAIGIHQPGLMHANMQMLDILEENGADLKKVVFGHNDPFFDDPLWEGYLTQALARGANIAFDTFGLVTILEAQICYPRDIDRLRMIRRFIELGYIKQIVLGQDTFSNIQLTKYGGFGYAHILEHVFLLMKNYGYTQEEIDCLMIENPKRIFSIQK